MKALYNCKSSLTTFGGDADIDTVEVALVNVEGGDAAHSGLLISVGDVIQAHGHEGSCVDLLEAGSQGGRA